jgi:hypothetical protein
VNSKQTSWLQQRTQELLQKHSIAYISIASNVTLQEARTFIQKLCKFQRPSMMCVNIARDWRQQPDDAAADNFVKDIVPPGFTAKVHQNVERMWADSTRKNYQGGDQPS